MPENKGTGGGERHETKQAFLGTSNVPGSFAICSQKTFVMRQANADDLTKKNAIFFV